MDVAVAPLPGGWVCAAAAPSTLRWEGTELAPLLDRVLREVAPESVRWVWQDSAFVVPNLAASGVPIARVRDLRLSRRILADAGLMAASDRWTARLPTDDGSLFQVGDPPATVDEVLAEHAAQQGAGVAADAASAGAAVRFELLLAAESMGAVIAAELLQTGLPWSASAHDRLLTDALGARPLQGRPPKLEALATRIRDELHAPALNPDSNAALLRALRSAGIEVSSTSRWVLRSIDHPAVHAVIDYKRLARLWTANGWHWAEQWVRSNRFHAEYVPAGVVTGRWATAGGGAMQIARQIRGAVVADEGWLLVVADAAQLEPRVLAAMSRDAPLAAAASGGDLYQGLVDDGVVDDRQRAKVAMLGALYGATTGDSGRLVPSLVRAYPAAMSTVDTAANAGERGEQVSTWLGRTSPKPAQAPIDVDDRDARSRERAWGRFTRNFVVQGSAAEWALCWMAGLRRRLATYDAPRPELVYFLHDEVIVHVPREHAERVANHVRLAASDAGRLLFGTFPIDFPVDAKIVRDYGEAKG